MGRQILLLVEGETERGKAQQPTLPEFFHRWLDPQLPDGRKVGVKAHCFRGVNKYEKDFVQVTKDHLDSGGAQFVVGLLDYYGLPPSFTQGAEGESVHARIRRATQFCVQQVPAGLRHRFRQHFAVHETEAWLLSDPGLWNERVRTAIKGRPPETINLAEPPAQLLARCVKDYKKTTAARSKFPQLDPQRAYEACPYLRLLMHDLLTIARQL